MSDYSKLKNFVSESRSANDVNPLNGLNNVKDSVFGFFTKNVFNNEPNRATNSFESRLPDDQNESWFKEAESDPFCPKLVNFNPYLI